jgi:hypothetical protein
MTKNELITIPTSWYFRFVSDVGEDPRNNLYSIDYVFSKVLLLLLKEAPSEEKLSFWEKRRLAHQGERPVFVLIEKETADALKEKSNGSKKKTQILVHALLEKYLCLPHSERIVLLCDCVNEKGPIGSPIEQATKIS